MRKLLGALAAFGFVASANASVVTFDNFDTDGSLISNGWTTHSGVAGDLVASGGQALVQHGAPSEDAHLFFGNPGGGSIYFGIDFSVDDLGAPYLGTDNEYFAHFMEEGTFNFRARFDVVEPSGGGDYSVGISTFSGAADATWGTDLAFGTTYRAIVRYDQGANIAQLWIDAALETDTSISGVDQTDPGTTIDSFALRQSDSSENELVRVDNLVVGTTFSDVVVGVPEPASLILLSLGGLALIRRR
jgi:hypothetical protein